MERATPIYCYTTMNSPVNVLVLVASDTALVGVFWQSLNYAPDTFKDAVVNDTHPILVTTKRQLQAYFEKKLQTFDIPIELIGSDFQKQVWKALLTVPYGKTKSYGDLARQLGDIKTVRAVGGALNRNPIAIIVPCHRIIGANGQLVGFGGGLPNKTILLDIEIPNQQASLF